MVQVMSACHHHFHYCPPPTHEDPHPRAGDLLARFQRNSYTRRLQAASCATWTLAWRCGRRSGCPRMKPALAPAPGTSPPRTPNTAVASSRIESHRRELWKQYHFWGLMACALPWPLLQVLRDLLQGSPYRRSLLHRSDVHHPVRDDGPSGLLPLVPTLCRDQRA